MELYIFSSTDISNKYFTETVLYTLMYINTALYTFLILLMSSNMRRAIRQFIRPKNTRGRLYTHEMSTQNVTRRAHKLQTSSRGVSVGVGSNPSGGLSANVAIQGSAGSAGDRITSTVGATGQGQQGQQEVSVSFIHVSPSGNHLNRLSSIASYSRSVSSNSSDRHSSSSTDSMSSYDVSDDVFYSFAPPKLGNNSPGGKSMKGKQPPMKSPVAPGTVKMDQGGTTSNNATSQSTNLPSTSAVKMVPQPVKRPSKDKNAPITSDA